MVILKIISLDLMMRIAGTDHMPVRVYASGGQDVNHKCGENSKQIEVMNTTALEYLGDGAQNSIRRVGK